MREKLKKRYESTKSSHLDYKPTFFHLTNHTDKIQLEELLNSPNLLVYDELLGQLEELIKSRNPKVTFKPGQLTAEAKNYLGKIPPEEYGVWVYYPWSQRLVHILDEQEFIDVRTNRNQHKITTEEREKLAGQKIGVIGLSVGQSVSVTLALERLFGELRIADFDILELSNLNRIRTGTHNLGINKTVAVAREIAEIDPFLKVTCFSRGLNEENIEDFFLKDGKLDLLIDECDGLDIKILCRHTAKKHKVPVVMEASDRGTIDVERFDLEPDRPILHGFIEHLDISQLKHLKTNEDKVPFLLPIVGLETLSKKAKASMMEVGQTITTWPQLASAVTLGGGITADVCRRIILDEFHESGRYFVDVEEIICDKNKVLQEEVLNFTPAMSENDADKLIKDANTALLPEQIDISEEKIKEFVEAAILAPTGANAQPWKWKYQNKALYLFFDIVYIAHLLDYEGTTSYIGLGCATENLILKAHQAGLEVAIEKFPLGEKSKLIAIFKFFPKNHKSSFLEPHSCDELAASIERRITNRKITPRQLPDQSILGDLIITAKTVQHADLKFITEEKELARLAEIIAKVDRIRVMHEGGHKDFIAEMRWTPEQADFMKNGVDINTIDLTPSEFAGFQIAKDWHVIDQLNKWKGGAALEKFSRKTALCASAIGLITMPEFTPLNFFEGGRATERIWLAATHKNLAFQPLTIATLIFNTFLHENRNIFPEEMFSELQELRKEFSELFPNKKNTAEVMLFRIFKADYPAKKSLRVPLQQVFSYNA